MRQCAQVERTEGVQPNHSHSSGLCIEHFFEDNIIAQYRLFPTLNSKIIEVLSDRVGLLEFIFIISD